MTTDDQQQETNQDVFDEYVRHVLEGTGVEYVESGLAGIEKLIAEIQDGEATEASALKLIAIAHARLVFLVIHTPYEDSDWSLAMEDLGPKIGSQLDRCVSLMEPHLEGIELDALSMMFHEAAVDVIAGMYGVPAFGQLAKKSLLPVPLVMGAVLYSLILTDRTNSQDDENAASPPISKSRLGRLAKHFHLNIEPNLRGFPSWYWHFIGHEITACLQAVESLPFQEWHDIVDYVADLMRQSEMDADYDKDNQHRQGVGSNYPVWSTENWAWQFGRVASLYHLAEPDAEAPVYASPADVGFDIELLLGWDNGLTALSLIAHGPHLGRMQEPDQLLVGLLAVGHRGTEIDEENLGENAALLPLMQLPTSRLYWIMRQGYNEGAKDIQESAATNSVTATTATQSVPDVDALLGSIDGLEDEFSDVAINKSAEGENPVVTIAEEVETGLREALPNIWDKLPRDVQRYLKRAEQSLASPPTVVTYPALEYAKAVEATLRILLSKPQELRRNLWPGSRIGRWIEALEGMAGPLTEFDALQMNLRNQFDAAYAQDLGDSLKIVAENRNPDAHDEDEVSLPGLVRDTILGVGQSPSIFELILRFARKWPPK